MNETAQKLGISQPAVTFQLKKLEEELPVPPFTTSGNRKVLNNFGRALFTSLEGRFHEIEVSINKVNNLYTSPENYTFRIGGRKEVLSRVLPRLEFMGTLEALSMNEDEIVSGLIHQKIDIAITYQPIERSDVFHKKLFTDQGKFCVHKKFLKDDHLTPALAKSPEFLLSTPVVAYNRKFPYLHEWLQHCSLKVSDLNIRCVYEDWNVIMRLVEKGMGYTIIPSEFIPDSEDVVSWETPASVIAPKSFYAFYHKDLKEMGIINQLFADFNQ